MYETRFGDIHLALMQAPFSSNSHRLADDKSSVLPLHVAIFGHFCTRAHLSEQTSFSNFRDILVVIYLHFVRWQLLLFSISHGTRNTQGFYA